MKTKSRIIVGLGVAGLTIAVAATCFAGLTSKPSPDVSKPKPRDCAASFGTVSFTNDDLNITGCDYTVTRKGVGLYTITYAKPFDAVPKLIIEPALRGLDLAAVNPTNIPSSDITGCVAPGYAVMAQSPTEVTILYSGGVDPTSEICVTSRDQFGNVITYCWFTRLLYGDVPFKFAAFE